MLIYFGKNFYMSILFLKCLCQVNSTRIIRTIQSKIKSMCFSAVLKDPMQCFVCLYVCFLKDLLLKYVSFLKGTDSLVDHFLTQENTWILTSPFTSLVHIQIHHFPREVFYFFKDSSVTNQFIEFSRVYPIG